MTQTERKNDTPGADSAPSPHPLAVELAAALRADAGARVLVLGIGNGRNLPPLLDAGLRVEVVESDAERVRLQAPRWGAAGARVVRARYAGPFPFAGGFAGALSTSALIHGTATEVAAAVAAVRARLQPGGRLFATFGSVRDPRFAAGVRIDAATVAPPRGAEEAGVPHAYFDEPGLRALLDGFTDLDLREESAAETAGRWAHSAEAAAEMMHWFVRCRRG